MSTRNPLKRLRNWFGNPRTAAAEPPEKLPEPGWNPEVVPPEKATKIPVFKKIRKARLLPDDVARTMEPGGNKAWHIPLAMARQETAPFSGTGYVQQPYADQYNLIWGVRPIRDLDAYRDVVRSDPWVQQSSSVQVNLALQKGYKWNVKEGSPRRDEMIAEVNDIFRFVRNDFDQYVLPQTCHDMLIYGYAVMEKVVNGDPFIDENLISDDELNHALQSRDIRNLIKGHSISDRTIKKFGLENAEAGQKAYLMNVKALDPYYIRVRRNALGDVTGYLQWLAYPPIAFYPSKIVHFRWMPRSVSPENAYGTSEIMSLVRTVQLKRAIEQNLFISTHIVVRPPVIWKTPEGAPPLSDTALAALIAANQERDAGSDIYATFGVTADRMVEPGDAIRGLVEFYKLIREEMIVGIGVPRDILGISAGGSSRANETVNWDKLIVKLHGLQQMLNRDIVAQMVIPMLKARGWAHEDIVENMPYMDWEDLAITDANLRSDRTIKEFRNYGLSINEFRQAIGRPPLKGDRGEMFYDDIEEKVKEPGFGSGDIERTVPTTETDPEDTTKDTDDTGKGRTPSDRDQMKEKYKGPGKSVGKPKKTAAITGEGIGGLTSQGLHLPSMGPKKRCKKCGIDWFGTWKMCPNCGGIGIIESPTE